MAQKTKEKGSQSALWDALASVKLSFFLLLLVAVASVLGTIVPQNETAEIYQKIYGAGWASLIQTLGLNDMYHSLWFLLILAGLAANLIICSLNRLPLALEQIRKDPKDELKANRPAGRVLRLGVKESVAADQAAVALKKLVGPVHRGEKDKKIVVFAQKGAWSRLGVYAVHLSVLVIMAGGIAGNLLGFKGFVNIPEGQAADQVVLERGQTRDLGFAVRLDKFTVSYYKDGTPSEFRSNLTFLKDNKPAQDSSIIVNDPADFDGIYFYQSSYGRTPSELVLDYEKDGKTIPVRLAAEKWADLPGGGKAMVVGYKEKVEMGAMYSGPLARIAYQPAGPPQEPIVLNAFGANSRFPAQGPVRFVIKGADTVWYTGLQVKYDPGVWLIWLGSGLMVLGFIVTFYFSHQKVWVSAGPAGKEGSKLEIAGGTNKNRADLGRLLDRVARELGATDDKQESK
ncbi:MAG: cytochrome c biogenesis protein ResB [Deltaproteobacteria bacterium]|nr:cytochrome c biogenesis protein ResB [Deltaproteobacteria bacterium]